MTLTARPRHRRTPFREIFECHRHRFETRARRYHVPNRARFSETERFLFLTPRTHRSSPSRARLTRGDSMGGGGREHARAEPTDPTDLETVEKHTSALVGTVLASILWVLAFGDRDDASEEA